MHGLRLQQGVVPSPWLPAATVPVAPAPLESAAAAADPESSAPWRTGDWFHAQIMNLTVPRDGAAPAVTDGMVALGPLPGSTAGPFLGDSGQNGQSGQDGQDGQNGQNGQAAYGPALDPTVQVQPAPAPGYTDPALAVMLPGMGPDYSQLATAQAPRGTAIVQIGDSLPKLAKRLLGDESRWVEIYELNRDQILNADVILPGMVLRLPQGPKPQPPPRPPAPNPPPPVPAHPAVPSGDAEALRDVTPKQLAHLGATDKAKFFAVLKPAAVESERRYGVPWQVTLAQAALESGWAKHGIGGYNIFGIKGKGPAGSVVTSTKEWRGGRYVTEDARFAKYHDYYEAVVEHGKLFHNGYYKKAMEQFPKDRDPVNFIKNINGIYATSPTYSQNIIAIMRQYGLI